jgi:GntR family transcriptional regulator/MocR family aminotransferase
MLHLELDHRGALNQQVLRALKRAIVDGRLAAGARLPSSRALAHTLGVSRNTVVDAFEQLVAEGFACGRVGAGTFVAPSQWPRGVASGAVARAPRLAAYGRRALRGESKLQPAERQRLRYNLEYGAPLVSPAMQSAWRRALSRAADRSAFDYPPAQGLHALRSAIADYLGRRRGIAAAADDVVVLGGTQQGVDLALRVLVDPGQSVVLEDPCYRGTRYALQALGARILGLPVDAEGLRVERLPRAGARLACITPSHQFPTGGVLSLARRIELLGWARRHDAWLLEDDYDGEFRHDGRPLAALKSLDVDGRVIYIGSFSKLAFPALRLGFIVVPPGLRRAFAAAKWLADRGGPVVLQAALAELMASGRFERLVRHSARALLLRRDALLAGLATHCAGQLEVEGGSAGMHLTAWLPWLRPDALPGLVAAAAVREVGIYPITPYYHSLAPRAGLLLGYAGLAAADLGEASRRLGPVLAAARSSRGNAAHFGQNRQSKR